MTEPSAENDRPGWKRLLLCWRIEPDPNARCGCGSPVSECPGWWPACDNERYL